MMAFKHTTERLIRRASALVTAVSGLPAIILGQRNR